MCALISWKWKQKSRNDKEMNILKHLTLTLKLIHIFSPAKVILQCATKKDAMEILKFTPPAKFYLSISLEIFHEISWDFFPTLPPPRDISTDDTCNRITKSSRQSAAQSADLYKLLRCENAEIMRVVPQSYKAMPLFFGFRQATRRRKARISRMF